MIKINMHNLTISIKNRQSFQYIILISITILAGVLRFYKLGEWSFWIDEIFTIENTKDFPNGNATRSPVSTMLISLLLRGLGTSEWSTRLIPALFGMALIPVLFFPVKKLFGPVVAMLACLLMALSPWHLSFSQNARYYTTLMLFYTIAFFIFFFSLERNRLWYMLPVFLFVFLAFQERLFALLFLPVVGSYVMLIQLLPIEKPAGLRLKQIVMSVAVILVIACGYLLYDTFNLQRTGDSLITAFLQRFVGQSDWHPQWLLTGAAYNIGIPLVCLGLYGAGTQLLKRSRAGLFITLGALVPLFAIMVLAPFTRTTVHYALMILPCWMILTAIGIKELYRKTRQGHRKPMLVLIFLIALVSVKDRVWIDVRHYVIGDWPVILFLGCVALSILLGILLLLHVISKIHHNDKTMPSSLKKWQLVWGCGILLPVLFHPMVANTLYYEYSHGNRANWRAAAAVFREHKTPGDVVYTTLPPLGTYYFGDATEPMGDLLQGEHINLQTVLLQHQRAWFIEEAGVTMLMGDTFAQWSDTHCETFGVFDNYIAGETWKLRIHLCGSENSSLVQTAK